MGRPLNKKFFGNRNIGSTGTGDNYGIGGEGLAAYTLAVQKGVVAITNTYKYFPTLSIPAPNLPTGVPATATVVWEINAITLSSNGSGDYTHNLSGVAIDSLAGSIWTAQTYPAITISTDNNGYVTAATLDTNNRGEWTTIDGTSIVTWGIVKGAANSAQLTITFRLKSITTLEKGSGYTSAPTLSWGRASSQTAGGQTQTGTPTVVLTTDSGYVGSATNQENSIQITAWVPATADAGRISGNGTSAVVGDIVRQSGSRKYIVRTAQGVGRVKLVAATPAKGEATIIATDSDGGTYYVTELRGRKAHIIKGDQTGTQFTTGTDGIDVPWTFNGASAPKVLDSQPLLQANVNVQIANT